MVDQRSTVERVLAVTAETVDRVVGWSHLPKPLALAVLVGIRSQLRALNLVDTDPDPVPPLDPHNLTIFSTIRFSHVKQVGA